MHGVVSKVISSTQGGRSDWISAISDIVMVNENLVQDKVCTISAQVEAIIGEIKDRNITSKKLARKWRFSAHEAELFAQKLNKCVQDNLI